MCVKNKTIFNIDTKGIEMNICDKQFVRLDPNKVLYVDMSFTCCEKKNCHSLHDIVVSKTLNAYCAIVTWRWLHRDSRVTSREWG